MLQLGKKYTHDPDFYGSRERRWCIRISCEATCDFFDIPSVF